MALVATNVDTGSIVARKVTVADTRAARRNGLLKHDSLGQSEGLWIVPSRGVHTFGMRFTIDLVALDEAGVVIDCVESMKPWRVRLPRKGTVGVSELPEGTLVRTGTRVGHRIELERVAAEPVEQGLRHVS